MKKPIRILQFGTGNFGRGGQSTIILNLGMKMNNEEFIFDYYVNEISDEKYIDIINEKGGKVFISKFSKINFITRIKKFIEINKIIKGYKVIHINTDNSFFPFVVGIIGKINKVEKIVIHSHSIKFNGKILRVIGHRILKFFLPLIGNEFLACSKKAAKWLYPRKILNKIKIINNGIDVEKYKFDLKKRKELREKMNLKNKFVLGNIGRFSYVKNHKFLIEIFNEIQKKEKESILLLIGNGELEHEIRKQVEQLNLKDKVIFLGITDKVEEYLQIMDVFIFPSNFEGLGLVAIEAQAAALKVIASNNIPEEVKLTDYLEFLSLKKSQKIWCEKILQYKNNYERKDTSKIIEKKGYSISNSVKNLKEVYMKNE